MINKIICLLSLLLVSTTLVKSQNNPEAVDFVKYFKVVQSNLPRERVYIHTDRDWYYFGDQIWFSAYTVSGGYNFLSNLSSLLYVELISPTGEMVAREFIELTDGRGQGVLSFDGASTKSGKYQIKAYTLWSQNFGEAYKFSKTIDVLTDQEKTNHEISELIDLQFLPESGYLINGLKSRVGFKAIGSYGLGKRVAGTIYDQDGDQIVSFESEHLGMGSFEITPRSGHTYYAEVDGVKYQLPKALNEGISMSMEQNHHTFQFDIRSEGLDIEKPFLLFGHIRGEVYSASLVKFTNGQSSIAVSKQNFPTGIVHFTLLDQQGFPVAERLAFNKNQVDNVETSITLNKEAIGLRDVVDIKTTLVSQNGASLSGSYSLSVFDDSFVTYNPYSTSIISQFFLESELKGHVENPGYYFSDQEHVQRHLDLLLMTQGWKAFDMKQLASREEIVLETLPEEGFTITGTVKTVIGRKPLQNASVILTVEGDSGNPKIALTDEEGRFGFNTIKGSGDALITVKAEHPDKGDRVYVALDEQFENLKNENEKIFQGGLTKSGKEIVAAPAIYEHQIQIQSRSQKTQMALQEYNDYQMSGELEEISVTADRKSENYLDRVLSSLQGKGTTVDFDEEKYLRDLPMEIVINQLPGVSVLGRIITIETGFRSINSQKLPPLIFLDGQQIDSTSLFSLNSADIKSITVARSAVDLAILGAEGARGAIVVKSQNNRLIPEKTKGVITDYIKTYQEPIAFYAPRYGVNLPQNYEQEDQRITLHWAPLLNVTYGIDETRFWTNDVPSTYRVVVQGLTENGIPFTAMETFVTTD